MTLTSNLNFVHVYIFSYHEISTILCKAETKSLSILTVSLLSRARYYSLPSKNNVRAKKRPIPRNNTTGLHFTLLLKSILYKRKAHVQYSEVKSYDFDAAPNAYPYLFHPLHLTMTICIQTSFLRLLIRKFPHTVAAIALSRVYILFMYIREINFTRRIVFNLYKVKIIIYPIVQYAAKTSCFNTV